MGVGIDLRVDARQVKEARKEIDFLNKGLREMEDAEIAPDKEGLQATSELIRKISEDIRRMKGLVVKGEQQGGLLKKEQFQEAATLSKRIGQNMGEYTKEITKARNELAKLLTEKLKLEKTSPADAQKWAISQDRLELLRERETGLRANYERLKRNDPKAQDLARRGGEYSEAIGGYGTAPAEEGGGGTAGAAMAIGFLRRAAGFSAMLMGGGTLLSVARQSWGEYHKQATKEADLLLRGVRYNRELSPWGYMQGEQADTAMALRKTTGAADSGTLSGLLRFSRLSGMDPLAAVGVAGGYYQATGADPQKQRQAIDALLFMGKQAKDGRSETLLGLINQNLMIASRAQGGRALSDAQASTITAQTTALYNSPGTMGFTSGLFQTMQNALMPGGDPGSEIMKWDIIGGFNGPMTASRALELERRRNAGLNDPQNLKRALAAARKFSSTRDGQIFYMMKLLAAFGQPGGVDQATAIIDNGDRLLNAKLPGSGTIAGGIAGYEGMWKESPAYDIGQRYAKDDYVNIMTGESLDPEAKKLQELKWKGKTLFGGGGYLKPNQYDNLIQTKARAYGINPLWLKSIIQEESGYNRFAISAKGAKGLGQFMPKTGRAYGLKTDADFFDPAKSIDASAHYLKDLQGQFGGDIGKATMAYNAGPDAVRRGYLSDETRSYQAKVMRDLGAATSSPDFKGWGPATQQQSEGVGLLTRIASTLDDISRKIGRTNFAPGAAGSLRPAIPVGR